MFETLILVKSTITNKAKMGAAGNLNITSALESIRESHKRRVPNVAAKIMIYAVQIEFFFVKRPMNFSLNTDTHIPSI